MAFTYSFTTIPDTDTDPDSPLTTGLMTGINHDLIHLREWIGKDYYAGAAENHIHDGLGSRAIPPMIAFIDHYCSTTLDAVWSGSGATRVISGHYGLFSTADLQQSDVTWRSDEIPMIVEARLRIASGTAFVFTVGAQDIAVTRRAVFLAHATADHVTARTVGAGTQDTDVGPVGGGGVDAWHIYRVDLTNPASVVFSIDGAVVATHSTQVPTGADLVVHANYGGPPDTRVDYLAAWASINPLSTA